MVRYAHLLCVIILSAACFACAPISTAPIPPAPPTPTSGIGTGKANCKDTDFAGAVQVLGAAYDPSTLTPPAVNTTPLTPGTPPYQDLVAAFDAAPPKLQSSLCLVTVYIDPNNTFSWGFRYPRQPSQHYIGLSANLWGGSSLSLHADILSIYETKLLAGVMQQAQMPWPPILGTPQPPKFATATSSGSSVDSSAMSVLAALSHELGHILWFDLIKGNNQNYDPKGFCKSTGTGYFDNSWSSFNPPPNWTALGVVSGTHAANTTQIQNIQVALTSRPPNFANAASLIDSLLESNSNSDLWPSLFGSISPEEDFVETFVFYILTDKKTNSQMPVTSMPLDIFATPAAAPAYTPDPYKDITNSNLKKELKRKIKCIDGAYSGSP
jgi:hypothetical protein